MYNKHLEEKFVWGSQIHYVSVQHIFLFNKVTNQADNIKSLINITRELDYWVALFIVQSHPLNKLRKWGLSYSNLAWERHLEDQFSKPDSCASVGRSQYGVGFRCHKGMLLNHVQLLVPKDHHHLLSASLLPFQSAPSPYCCMEVFH